MENRISQLELDEETFDLYERYIQNNIRLRDRQKYQQLQNRFGGTYLAIPQCPLNKTANYMMF